MRCRVVLGIIAVLFLGEGLGFAERTPWMRVPDEEFGQGWGLFDLENLYDTGRWAEANSLSGDWGGLRHRLYDAGIAIVGSYENQIAANPATGEMRTVRDAGTASVAAFFDLERLAGLRDTLFLASMVEREGRSTSDAIPNLFPVQQIYGGETIRLDHLAVEKSFLAGKLDVVAGRINALDDFAVSNFYCYSQNGGICGSLFSLETNASLSNYPFASWGIRERYDLTPDLYSMTGVYNTREGFARNEYHGVDFSIRDDSGVAVMQEFGYRPTSLRQAGYPGFIKLGGFYDSEPRHPFPDGEAITGNWTIYSVAQQRLFRRACDGYSQGLTGFLALTYSPPASNAIEYFADGGLIYRGLMPSRKDDALGAFAVFGEFSPNYRDAQRAVRESVQTYELVLELNYRIQITSWSAIQPDVQYIIRPDGTGATGNALVLAFYTIVRF